MTGVDAPATPPAGDAVAEPALRRRRLWLLVGALALVAAVVAVTLVAVTSGDDDTDSASGDGSAAVEATVAGTATTGQPAPDFALPGFDGGSVHLSDFAGTPLVLNFWASYCRPCRQEFPLLKRELGTGDGSWQLLGIDSVEPASDGIAFADAHGGTWPMASDARNVVSAAYGVTGLPLTAFIAADGTLVSRVYGELDRATFREHLAAITR